MGDRHKLNDSFHSNKKEKKQKSEMISVTIFLLINCGWGVDGKDTSCGEKVSGDNIRFFDPYVEKVGTILDFLFLRFFGPYGLFHHVYTDVYTQMRSLVVLCESFI